MKVKTLLILSVSILNLQAQDKDLLRKANSGDTTACDLVGTYMYQGSNGFNKDNSEAEKYFQKSSQTGEKYGNTYGDFMTGIISLDKGDEDKTFRIWKDMRAKHDAYSAKMKPERDAKEVKKKLKNMQDQIDVLNAQQKKNKRRLADLEYSEER